MFPQNETHIQNMLLVKKELEKKELNIVFLNTNYIFKQSLVFNTSFNIDDSLNKLVLDKSFYILSAKDKIKIIITLKKTLKNIAEEYDSFIFGNDGAIQRLLIYYAKIYNKPTFIILDGMISDYSFKFIDIILHSSEIIKDTQYLFKNNLKIILSKTFNNTYLSIFLPSFVGCSQVDTIFLMGEHSKKILEKKLCNHQRKNIYIATGIPRYIFLKKYRNKKTYFNDLKIITYLTGAFKWHNYSQYDKFQHQDINLLINIIEGLHLSNIKLIIKVHPRDEIESYTKYSKYKFIEIIKEGDVFQVISNSNLIISHISTTLIESLVLNKKSISMMINFPYWKFKNSFISSQSIEKVYSKEELKKIIKSLMISDKSISENIVYNDLFSKNTFNSLEMITNIIISKIKNKV
jgi:hypothetical protein